MLVLGFSKGANQKSALPFDRIAFNNARANLIAVLSALRIVGPDVDMDACFTAEEQKLGFASVVRCGLGKLSAPGKYATSGDVVRSAIEINSPVRKFFDRCTEQYLGQLPESVRAVIFLGLDEPYVEAVFERMKELHPTIRRLNALAYATDRVAFVHVIHPSPLATSHRQKWLAADDTSLARKRRIVMDALCGSSSAVPLIAEQPFASVRVDAAQKVAKMASRPAELEPVSLTTSVLASKTHDFRETIRAAIRDGRLLAEEIRNKRRLPTENKKLLRLTRSDGEEFAFIMEGESYKLWSSIKPNDGFAGLSSAKLYGVTDTRHSGLDIMPKLRGPKPKRGVAGARAWYLEFATSGAALDFILG